MFPIYCANCGVATAFTTNESAIPAVKDEVYCEDCKIQMESEPTEEEEEDEEEESDDESEEEEKEN